ncbi:MAG: methionyl-tRNA formyltransferase [Candidatus Hydrogenedentes bacterium]|nr:methionyl-tRNA formyltransferase [Candidatus Hydrogenedentota bacterium]
MREEFRIILTGQAAFGERVLNALVDRGENIVGVFCPPDRKGKPADPIKQAAEKHGIAVFQFQRMRDAEAIEAFETLRGDLGVMAFVTDIVPEEIIAAPGLGTIQYHPSLLPKHRGPSSINWPIIQGETKTGLSIFWPDTELDTGPILLQKEVDILPDDTLGTMYFDKLFTLGVDAMLESVAMVKDGTAPKIPQDESQMTYESWCLAEDVVIDWDAPIGQIHNMVRGSDPSPGANSTFNGEAIKFYTTTKEVGSSDARPGEVLKVDEEGFSIAARDGALKVRRVQPDGSKKIAASEWVELVGLNVGDRFGS